MKKYLLAFSALLIFIACSLSDDTQEHDDNVNVEARWQYLGDENGISVGEASYTPLVMNGSHPVISYSDRSKGTNTVVQIFK